MASAGIPTAWCSSSEFASFKQEVLSKVSLMGIPREDPAMSQLWKVVTLACSPEGSAAGATGDTAQQVAVHEKMLSRALAARLGAPRAKVFVRWLRERLQAALLAQTTPPPEEEAEQQQQQREEKEESEARAAEETSAEGDQEEWVKMCTAEGRPYYWGRHRQACRWALPAGGAARWTGVRTDDGRTYYFGEDRKPVWVLPQLDQRSPARVRPAPTAAAPTWAAKLSEQVPAPAAAEGVALDSALGTAAAAALADPAGLFAAVDTDALQAPGKGDAEGVPGPSTEVSSTQVPSSARDLESMMKRQMMKETAKDTQEHDEGDSTDEDVEVPGIGGGAIRGATAPSPDRCSESSSSSSHSSSPSVERSPSLCPADEGPGKLSKATRARHTSVTRGRSQDMELSPKQRCRSPSAERWMPSPSASSELSVSDAGSHRSGRSRGSAERRSRSPSVASATNAGEEQARLLQRAETLRIKLQLKQLKHELGDLHKLVSEARAGKEAGLHESHEQPLAAPQVTATSAPAEALQGTVALPPVDATAAAAFAETEPAPQQAPQRWCRRLRKKLTNASAATAVTPPAEVSAHQVVSDAGLKSKAQPQDESSDEAEADAAQRSAKRPRTSHVATFGGA